LQFLGGKTPGCKQLTCQLDAKTGPPEFGGYDSVIIPTVERSGVIMVLTVIKLRTIMGR
jgi:hypothetical protein